MSVRGGMASNPFGRRMVDGVLVSNPRLDKLDIHAVVMNGDTPPEYGIFAEILAKAIHNYWYWGLGNNGCTDVKWLDAVDYLFKIRSDDPGTWGDRMQCYSEDLPNGTRIRHEELLSDEDMRLRCFDVHYKLLNLDKVIPFSGFLRHLEETRSLILKNNREQIETYLESKRVKEYCRMPLGYQIQMQHHVPDFVRTLTKPESIRQVEELVMFPVSKRKFCRNYPAAKTVRNHSHRKSSLNGSRSRWTEGDLLEKANVGDINHSSRSAA